MIQTQEQKARTFASQLLDVAKAAQTGDVDITLAAIERFRKSQAVRLFDVWVFGPLAMFYAYKGRLSSFERFVLFTMGLGTIAYNLRNYQLNQQLINPQSLLPVASIETSTPRPAEYSGSIWSFPEQPMDTGIPEGMPQGIRAPDPGEEIPPGVVF